ncbi:hypothetical protein [Paludisphaera soli]|uniref:hypothetical protein n=1 Tax=Paludisphaera soli TaxID=2712865 RepID=UPI0013EC25ED|nr:hypothetical protein [Paludisphaera soli]
MTIASALAREPAWYVKIPFLVGCALLVLSSPIWLPFAFLAAWLVARLQDIQERRFVRRMRKCGRYIEWADLEPALEAGDGTLVFEQGYKLPVRVWWTPDDLLVSAPCPPLTDEEFQRLAMKSRPHAFVAWCHRRYTDEERGAALLTSPADLPDGYYLAPAFRERCPRIRAIDTVYCYLGDRNYAA